MAEIRIADVKEIHVDQPLQMFAPNGSSHWCRRLCIVKADGTAEWITFAGASASALALPSDVAEARLAAYADQARESYTAPTLTEYPLTTTDYALPDTQGEVDLAAEANPPRFQIGDRVTPVKAGDGLLAGKVYTVDEVHFHSTTGEELTGVEGADRRWSNAAFRLAPADPLADDALLEQMESDLYPDGLPAE